MGFETFGWVALFLTQLFYVPNTFRILRTRNVQGYSLSAWLLMSTGLACYLVYFLGRGDVVGIIANVSGVAGAALTTACIWVWRDRDAGQVA